MARRNDSYDPHMRRRGSAVNPMYLPQLSGGRCVMAQCTTVRNGRVRHKVPYRTKRQARIGLRRAARKYGFDEAELGIYRCDVCGLYHYGRKKECRHESSRVTASVH